jgi:hypothetical protein
VTVGDLLTSVELLPSAPGSLDCTVRLRPELSLPSRFAFAATCRRYRWIISSPEAPAIRLAVASKAACIFSLAGASTAAAHQLHHPNAITRFAWSPYFRFLNWNQCSLCHLKPAHPRAGTPMLYTLTVVLALIGLAAIAMVIMAVWIAMVSRRRGRRPRAS